LSWVVIRSAESAGLQETAVVAKVADFARAGNRASGAGGWSVAAASSSTMMITILDFDSVRNNHFLP